MKRRTMILAVGAAALSLIAQYTSYAQAPPAHKPDRLPPGQRGPQRGKWLQETLAKLKLTPEQRARVEKLMAESRAEVRKIRQASGTAEERVPKVRAAMRARRQKLNAILTPQQQAQLRQAMRERREALRKSAPRPSGA